MPRTQRIARKKEKFVPVGTDTMTGTKLRAMERMILESKLDFILACMQDYEILYKNYLKHGLTAEDLNKDSWEGFREW